MTLRKFKFNKNSKGEWYMDLPEWSGDAADLQMVEGADQWLALLSNKEDEVEVMIADEHFDHAESLVLLRVREANLGGGGDYCLEIYQGKKINLKLWLCEVTRFVFGNLPKRIYFKVETYRLILN
jgi:hypothetical protein